MQSGCLGCRPIQGSFLTILSIDSLPRGLSQNPSRGHPWHQPGQEVAGPSATKSDVESTEVVYKIRQWSLPGAAVMPVLNVSSRVTLIKLAPGQRLTVAIMLPGRQLADDWLDFFLGGTKLRSL